HPCGLVLIHHSPQLGLREFMFAETAAVAREHRFGHLQSDASKGRSPTSAIAPPASIANTDSQALAMAKSHGCSEDVNRAELSLYFLINPRVEAQYQLGKHP